MGSVGISQDFSPLGYLCVQLHGLVEVTQVPKNLCTRLYRIKVQQNILTMQPQLTDIPSLISLK